MNAMKTILLASSLIFAGFAQGACLTLSVDELQQRFAGQDKTLVFFASWCASCKKHVLPERSDRAIFVASVDEPSRAEAVLKLYLGQKADTAICVFDASGGIAKRYGVHNLPQEKPL